jgi:CheY-like chemotaxis protein
MIKRDRNAGETAFSEQPEAHRRRITSEFETVPADPRLDCQPCLLIIASKSVNAEALRELLQLDHRRIEVATDGAEALRLADLIRPDMVLCDLQLKGAPSAYAVAQALRSDPLFEHIYLVGLTSVAGPAPEEFAIRSGFDQVMPLSGDIRELEGLIQRLWFTEEMSPR